MPTPHLYIGATDAGMHDARKFRGLTMGVSGQLHQYILMNAAHVRTRHQSEHTAIHPHLPQPTGTQSLIYRAVRLVRWAMPAIACCVMNGQRQ